MNAPYRADELSRSVARLVVRAVNHFAAGEAADDAPDGERVTEI